MTIWEWALVAWFVVILSRNTEDALLALLTSAILTGVGCADWAIGKLL